MPKRQRFGDMNPRHGFSASEIGDRAAYTHGSGIAARRQTQALHRLFQQLVSIRLQPDGLGIRLGVAQRTIRAIPFGLASACPQNALGDDAAGFPGRSVRQFRRGRGLDGDGNVDAVQYRAADTVAVILTASGAPVRIPVRPPPNSRSGTDSSPRPVGNARDR